MSIDLHSHSSASDGSDSPEQLVCRAARLGIRTLAITDHDTTAGLEEGQEAGRRYGVEVLRGCELSTCDSSGRKWHILGLWIPKDCAALEQELHRLREYRRERGRKILQRLSAMGISLSLEEVSAIAKSGNILRPHIARALVAKGFARDIRDAMTRFIGDRAPAYVPMQALLPRQAVTLLAGMGATVSLAHPFLGCRQYQEALEDLIADLRPRGLRALEAYHSAHTYQQTRACVELAARHGLLLSGGSDYHGLAKPGIELACGRGSLHIPDEVLEHLKRQRQQLGLPC